MVHFEKDGQNNIVLIGMPGSGKSTSGVLLAKSLGFSFLDTDLLIQEQEGLLLQDIADCAGFDGFVRIEERSILGLNTSRTVISTGGSVIYSERSMAHLKKLGIVVYLKVSFEEIMRRVRNISTRGIALKEGQDLKSLYQERVPLYEKYADLTVTGDEKTIEETVTEIAARIRRE